MVDIEDEEHCDQDYLTRIGRRLPTGLAEFIQLGVGGSLDQP